MSRLIAGRYASYIEYLSSPEWNERRLAAYERAYYRCQVCNSPQRLNAHHRTYERIGREQPEDITVLCADCHRKHHGIDGEAIDQALCDTVLIAFKRLPYAARSSQEVALASGLSLPLAAQALQRLQAARLVRRSPSGYWRLSRHGIAWPQPAGEAGKRPKHRK